MRRLASALAVALLALAPVACSDDGGGDGGGGDGEGGTAPSSTATSVATTDYDRALCDLVYGWRGVLSEGVERLSREGVPQPPPARHQLAVDVVEELVAATEDFAEDVRALGAPPDGELGPVVEEQVTAGAAGAVAELENARRHFAELSDADFEDLVVRGAELASYLEKASSLVTQRLEILADEHGFAGPNEVCGTGRLVD